MMYLNECKELKSGKMQYKFYVNGTVKNVTVDYLLETAKMWGGIELNYHEIASIVRPSKEDKVNEFRESEIYDYLSNSSETIDTMLEDYITNDVVEVEIDYCITNEEGLTKSEAIRDEEVIRKLKQIGYPLGKIMDRVDDSSDYMELFNSIVKSVFVDNELSKLYAPYDTLDVKYINAIIDHITDTKLSTNAFIEHIEGDRYLVHELIPLVQELDIKYITEHYEEDDAFYDLNTEKEDPFASLMN